MKRINLLLIAIILLLGTLNVSLLSQNKPLNIIFCLIDDLGWKDLSYMGSEYYETPAIDNLANDGMVFTDAYMAAPRCVASRTSVLTGKYHYRPELKKGHGIPEDQVLFSEAFKENGYRTFFAGKWHLGGKGHYPEDQGFDVNIGGCEYGNPPSYFYPYSTKKEPTPHNIVGGEEGEYMTDRLTDETINFIQDHLKNHGPKPFLAYLSHYGVHGPFEAKDSLIKKYKDKLAKMEKQKGPDFIIDYTGKVKMKQDFPVYAAMIESIDHSIAKIRAELKKLGIEQNTAIVFTSDNGGLSTCEAMGKRRVATSNYPLRTGKGWIYEGGIREPFIVYWPGVTKPGSITNKPIVGTDIYPTLLEIAGLPLIPEQHVDGVSFAPLLKGDENFNRKPIIWYYKFAKKGTGNPGMAAIRDGDYKLVEFLLTKEIELYNLKEDIGEQNNLAEQMPDKAAELKKIMDDFIQEINPTPMETNKKFVATNKRLLEELKLVKEKEIYVD